MSYVDAHLHLADHGYSGQIDAVLEDARQNEINYLLANGTDYASSVNTVSLAKQNDDRVIAAVGVHPWTATNVSEPIDLSLFEELVTENRELVRAIGEIGLDGKYTQDPTKKHRQREIFEFFLTLAERNELPVIVHSRLAIDDVLRILPSFKLPKVLMHWYSGSTGTLNLIEDRGYLITVGPSIFYSRRTAEIADKADLSIILTETDGPVSYRGPFEGRPTRPSFVIEVVQELAKIKKIHFEKTRDTIWVNFDSLLSLRH